MIIMTSLAFLSKCRPFSGVIPFRMSSEVTFVFDSNKLVEIMMSIYDVVNYCMVICEMC